MAARNLLKMVSEAHETARQTGFLQRIATDVRIIKHRGISVGLKWIVVIFSDNFSSAPITVLTV
jgi:hypothetical protein